MPSTIVNAYQGLLPTYLYAFQFSVNTVDRGKSISFADPRFAILMVFLVVASGVVAYSAWAWRQALAPDDAARRRERRPASAPTGPTRPERSGRHRLTRPSKAEPQPAPATARGDGGIGAVKCAGRAPVAASRRIAKP